jgi:hypothetical protein
MSVFTCKDEIIPSKEENKWREFYPYLLLLSRSWKKHLTTKVEYMVCEVEKQRVIVYDAKEVQKACFPTTLDWLTLPTTSFEPSSTG